MLQMWTSWLHFHSVGLLNSRKNNIHPDLIQTEKFFSNPVSWYIVDELPVDLAPGVTLDTVSVETLITDLRYLVCDVIIHVS